MQALGEGAGVTKRTSRNWFLAVVVAALAAVVALAWHAGGPEEMREIAVPVAVPEMPQ